MLASYSHPVAKVSSIGYSGYLDLLTGGPCCTLAHVEAALELGIRLLARLRGAEACRIANLVKGNIAVRFGL